MIFSITLLILFKKRITTQLRFSRNASCITQISQVIWDKFGINTIFLCDLIYFVEKPLNVWDDSSIQNFQLSEILTLLAMNLKEVCVG